MKKLDESELTIIALSLILVLVLAAVFSWLFAFVSG